MPKTLLIVEDDKEEQEKAKKIYEEAGFKVIVAGTYEEFQQKARQFNYFNDRSQGVKYFTMTMILIFQMIKRQGNWWIIL